VLAPCSKIYDGRWANNAWLQELPESFSKLSWGNAALMAPATAAALGVTDGTPVRLTVEGRSIDLPVMLVPGQAAGSVKVALGYGRLSAGVGGRTGRRRDAGRPRGANAYKLRSTKLYRFGGGLQVSPWARRNSSARRKTSGPSTRSGVKARTHGAGAGA